MIILQYRLGTMVELLFLAGLKLHHRERDRRYPYAKTLRFEFSKLTFYPGATPPDPHFAISEKGPDPPKLTLL